METIPPTHTMTVRHICFLFLQHLRLLPTWHFRILIAAAIAVGIGAVGVARRTFVPSRAAQQNAIAPGQSASASAHNGFVSDSAGQPTQTTLAPADDTPWYLSPRFLRVGGSTIGGFVIGWMMRTFVKTVTLLLAAVAGLIGAASYFRFFNVDFSAAHQQFETAAAWMTNQMSLLKDVAIAHLPSHAGGMVGTYIGFRRR